MKAVIQDGKIYNFVDDGYIAGNKEIDSGAHPTIKIEVIEGFSPDVDQDEVAKNNTMVKDCFIYYLEKGVVKKLKLEEQPEYVAYQKGKRAAAYVAESDALFFKCRRGEIEEQVWLDKVAEIKNRFPY